MQTINENNAMMRAFLQKEIDDYIQIQASVAAFFVTGMNNHKLSKFRSTTECIEKETDGYYSEFRPGKTDFYLELENETLHFCDQWNGYKIYFVKSLNKFN